MQQEPVARAHEVREVGASLSDPRFEHLALRLYCDACSGMIAPKQEKFWMYRRDGLNLMESLDKCGATRSCCRALLQSFDV